MRILILGPGALGTVLGNQLRQGGAEVTFVGRDGPRGPTAGAELAIVAVKSGETDPALARLIPILGPETAVVSLQNGLGNVEKIAERVAPERTFGGSTTHAARRLASGEVLHTAKGETRIAPFARDGLARGQAIADALTARGLPTTCEPDLAVLLWEKLAVSCALNALSGVLGVENGELARLEGARALVIEAAREVGRTAERYGVRLPREPGERALEVARATARNKTSLLQDLEAGRPTEVAYLNGAAVERAARVGLDLPVNRVLCALVRAVEERGRR